MDVMEAPAKKPGFFYRLIAGRDGNPDEAALAFLVGAGTIVVLKTCATIWPTHPFNAGEFSAGYGGLLAFYNASKGVMGKLAGGPS